MRTFSKTLGLIALVATVSAGVSLGIYSYKENQHKSSANESTFSGQVPGKQVWFTDAAAANPDFSAAAEKSVHGVVHIKSTVVQQTRYRSQDPFFEFFFGQREFEAPSPRTQEGIGSGVIISNDGYIITNNHVIDNAEKIEVTLNDKRAFDAKLIGADPYTDIALLKIDADNLPIIPFGDSDKLRIGEWVLAIGNPFNLTSTVTAGIVSAKARSIGIGKKLGIESFIQTDAAVNPGNSGGALVNTTGELVGINTAIATMTGNYEGYSFAVPISIASKVVSDLKQFGTVQRALMGVNIRDINADFAKEKNLDVLEGVYIESVSERSSAMEAGIEAGDVITEINGIKVKSANELQEQINRYRPGDKIVVKGFRGKTAKTFNLTLKNRQGTTEITKEKGLEILGAAFKELTPELKKQLGISYGVQVAGLTDGKFQTAGIRKGFIITKINNQPVKSQADVETMTGKILASDEQALFITGVYPNGKTGFYAIDLSE
ncbi:MAG: Do family serine endopeptidase [Bacteroidales bacterium]|jgi:Do/DeqQ family serine protease|nr:Do family serine endopeptidase [Bacteroidales bacterium]